MTRKLCIVAGAALAVALGACTRDDAIPTPKSELVTPAPGTTGVPAAPRGPLVTGEAPVRGGGVLERHPELAVGATPAAPQPAAPLLQPQPPAAAPAAPPAAQPAAAPADPHIGAGAVAPEVASGAAATDAGR
jgi:hypothetical protein